MDRKIDILVLDDKEEAQLQVRAALDLAGGYEAKIDWVARGADLAGLGDKRYDLAFVDWFLDKDRAYGVDFLDRIIADWVVGFSSNITASELIEKAAKTRGFRGTASVAKLKDDRQNPMLEAFFRALPEGRPGNKPLWLYRQSGVLPFRREAGGLSLVLVTSRKDGEWILPKGVVERGVSPADSALKEAREEAGILGRIAGPELGRYRYPKWEGICTVILYPMEVLRVLDSWDERLQRSRAFLPPEEALKAITNPDIRNLVARFLEGGLAPS